MKRNFYVLLFIGISFKLLAQVEIIFDKIELAKKSLPEVTYAEAIENRIKSEFEACEFKFRKDSIITTDIHPFISSLHIAYADHRPISLSPDMIWLLICQGFSLHVNTHIEELRQKFVDFDNKKTLSVNTLPISDEFKKGSIKSPWPLTFHIFADSISKYVGSGIHDLYVQKFSTTTYMEKAAYEVSLMDGMSGYFEYEWITLCGIPLIKIEGTKADWLKIKNDLQRFRGYHIDYWIDALDPIIQEFINALENNINQEFWSNIYKLKDDSGGPFIRGWIIKFFPYINTSSDSLKTNPYVYREPEGFMEGLETNQFSSGLSKVDFVWNYFNTKYEMELLAGFIGIRQNKETLTLRPEIGWIVKDKGEIK